MKETVSDGAHEVRWGVACNKHAGTSILLPHTIHKPDCCPSNNPSINDFRTLCGQIGFRSVIFNIDCSGEEKAAAKHAHKARHVQCKLKAAVVRHIIFVTIILQETVSNLQCTNTNHHQPSEKNKEDDNFHIMHLSGWNMPHVKCDILYNADATWAGCISHGTNALHGLTPVTQPKYTTLSTECQLLHQ